MVENTNFSIESDFFNKIYNRKVTRLPPYKMRLQMSQLDLVLWPQQTMVPYSLHAAYFKGDLDKGTWKHSVSPAHCMMKIAPYTNIPAILKSPNRPDLWKAAIIWPKMIIKRKYWKWSWIATNNKCPPSPGSACDIVYGLVNAGQSVYQILHTGTLDPSDKSINSGILWHQWKATPPKSAY